MSFYHQLEKRAYGAPPAMPPLGAQQGNPYTNVNPAAAFSPQDWASAPGLRQPVEQGIWDKTKDMVWRNKARIGGTLAGAWAGGKAGVAAGAAIGSPFAGVGAIPGAVIGGTIGSIAGGWIGSDVGGAAGGAADDYMNGKADAAAKVGQPYRPPVTGMASYGANMLTQGIDDIRAKNNPK